MNKILPFGFLAGCLILAPAAQSTTLTLDPTDGALTGLPGTTVGWGFTFTNDADFAVITGTEFCTSASSDLPAGCLLADPSFGTYTDFAGSQFLVIGPSPETSPITQPFDNIGMTGMGSFAIDPSASGAVTGDIVVTYDLYSLSPNDPDFTLDDEISGGNVLIAPASITAGAPTATPEPGLLPLLAAGLLGVVMWQSPRFRRKERLAARRGR